MKLNQKGYMLIEIVIASVLAMSIALYLLNLTYEFKNKNEDIYQSISYSSDKIAITKNIMNDLDRIKSSNISCDKKNTGSIEHTICEFSAELKKDNSIERRRLQISEQTDGTTTIYYGKTENGNFMKSDVSYYEKQIQESLIVGTIEVRGVTDETKYLTITIPIQSLYENKKYDIKLMVNKMENVYTITYHSNGSNLESPREESTQTQTVSYGAKETLTKNTFAFTGYTVSFDDSLYIGGDCIGDDETGYFECSDPVANYPNTQNTSITQKITFMGWATSVEGEVVYNDEAQIVQNEKLSDDQLQLYAKWKETIKLPSAQTISGYPFEGWAIETDNNTYQLVGKAGETYIPTRDITLYAVYSE